MASGDFSTEFSQEFETPTGGSDFSSEFSFEFFNPDVVNAQNLVKNPRRGIRATNATARGIRQIAVPHVMRRRHRYPISIIPPQRLNIYKESVPDVYAPTDVYSTGSDSGPEVLAPPRTVTDPIIAPPITVGGTDIEAILLMALDL